MKMATLGFILFGLIFLAGCGGGVVSPTPQAEPTISPAPGSAPTKAVEIYWPAKDWRVSTPAEQGMDPAGLEALKAEIRAKKLGLHSFLIIRNGYIVSEDYYAGHQPEKKHVLYSCTKSFVSTLVGIAIDQGKIAGVDQKILSLLSDQVFANPSAEKDRLTLDNVLTMTAGLAWVEADVTFQNLYMTTNWVKTILDLPMSGESGEQFSYCSGCSHILSAVVQKAVGLGLRDYADQALFKPLGITDLTWEADSQGIPIGGWGLYMTPRDMARLGYLFLRQGIWDNQVIVSRAWVQAATSAQVDTGGELRYGYQWWVIPESQAYAALGRYGQTIYVKPDADLIVVTTAQMDDHDEIFRLINEFVLPAIK